jgi:hypothetical protein
MVMKNSIIKIGVILSVALLIGVLFPGCNKFLDREPLGRYTQDDLKGGSFESQVFGMYAGARGFGVSALPYILIHNTRSDDADKGSSVSDGVDAENIFDNFKYIKDFWLLNGYWTDHYALIGLANNVISNIDSAKDNSAAAIVNRAEAKFMRAYAYFNLVRAFGEVPKIDFKVTDAAQANIAKSTIPDIYTLIDADLQEASVALPPTWESKFIGRLTQGAAQALRAKTMLYRQNWAGALGAARLVISSNLYSLYKPYAKIFTEDGENCSESIFEIQAYYSATLDLGVQYAQVQGVRGSGNWDLGWGWNTPNQSLVDAFEDGDPRKDATLLYSGQPDPYGVNGNVPDASADIPRKWWNKKVYTNPAIRAAVGGNEPRFGKWFNVRILRYADVLLMAAEAANELGGEQNITDALAYLEQVRDRARNGNNAILPKITTRNQGELRDLIRHERRVELGMENERFFDLVRWGIDVQVFHAAGKTGYEIKNRFLPIPQPEIDRSGGKLIQNPDY